MGVPLVLRHLPEGGSPGQPHGSFHQRRVNSTPGGGHPPSLSFWRRYRALMGAHEQGLLMLRISPLELPPCLWHSARVPSQGAAPCRRQLGAVFCTAIDGAKRCLTS